MSVVTLNDIIGATYEVREAAPQSTLRNTALLLIDVQQLASPEHLAEQAKAAGLPSQEVDTALEDYAQRFYAAVENCKTLLDCARHANVPCIHIRIEALSGNARDTGPAHRRLGWCYPPGSKETKFLSGMEPKEGEVVISKTVSGAFTATNLDAVLRHMGIAWLLVAGFMADECVEATVRVALDLGYTTLVANDASTAYEQAAHQHTMAKYKSWGLLRQTDELVKMLLDLRQLEDQTIC